jgi:hypothetical protein
MLIVYLLPHGGSMLSFHRPCRFAGCPPGRELEISRYRPNWKYSAARAFVLFGSYGPPAHSVSSLSWMRSWSTPPNTIAPSRPLPTASASTHFAAGRRYHKLNGSSGARVRPMSSPVKATPRFVAAGGFCAAQSSATTHHANNIKLFLLNISRSWRISDLGAIRVLRWTHCYGTRETR